MAALAQWCFRHRWIVVGVWLGLLLVLGASTGAFGTKYNDEFKLPGTESTKALNLLTTALPAQAGDTDNIVFHVDSGGVTDAAVKARVSAMLDKVSTMPSVDGVTSPYSEAGAAQISKDGRTAYATVAFDKQADVIPLNNIQHVLDTAKAAHTNTLDVAMGGQAIERLTPPATSSSELVGVVAAAVILFIAFGSLLPMVLPLVVAIAALGCGILSIGLLSHAINLGSIAPTLATLIGLGVGIDYALFVVTRHRTGLRAGLDPQAAAVRALNTSGRAVLFAGGTVCVALLGLLVLRVSFLSGMGIGASITVLWTVASAITLLPAMLGFLGPKALGRKERRALAADGPLQINAIGAWARWSAVVERRKAALSAIALLIVVALSIPVLSLRLGSSDAGNNAKGTTTREAYDLLASGFGPGFNGPLQLVAQLPSPGDAAALTALVDKVEKTKGVAAVATVPMKPGATIGIVSVVPTTAPQDAATSDLIETLRHDLIPAAEHGTTMHVYVGGTTAIFADFAKVLTSKLPLFLGVIVLLGCLLMLVAFRSIVIPLTAAAMNVFAALAAFGVVTAIFEWGWGASLLGIGREGPVDAFVPVIMLAILFGLSMDYQVFLVSRMHEEWVHSHDNKRAVRIGQAETGRVITAAATIMICVFVSFVFGGQRVIAEFGIGLASAVAIDAFVLRTVLVPALMHLFGRANWWLPGWLDRALPHMSVEPADEEAVEPVPVAAGWTA
jgi:putative drug exporter of the RND superfamily